MIYAARGFARFTIMSWAAVAAFVLGAHSTSAGAQADYPNKAIRFMVGQAPGGATDIMARAVAEKLGKIVSQPVVVENRSGAAGSIAATLVAKSLGDGYTLLVVSSSYSINPSLNSLSFDPQRDLEPVVLLAEAPFLLVVNTKLPAHSVKELLSYAKSSGRELTFSSGGTGSSGHLAGELLKSLTGIRMLHVPYKGAGPATIDVMGGQIDMTFASMVSVLPHVKSGELRALGVTGAKRSATTPDVPTIAEAGVSGYSTVTWYGVLAPASTSRAIVETLNADLNQVLKSRELLDRMALEGAEAMGGTPERFATYLDSEIRKWAKIIRDAGVN